MYLMLFIIMCVVCWWLCMTNPKSKDWGGLWDPADGPESEDELND